MTRYDKLGRRIPEFDRSAANKKGAKTRKELHGTDIHSRVGSMGARLGTRGYFGYLKDQGKTEELKKLSKKGVETRRSHREHPEGSEPVSDDVGGER